MKSHPTIFSGPMVRALLDGRKTQTRRLATSPLRKVEPGDTLWVRENFWPWTGSASGKTIVYQADDEWIDWGSGERFREKVKWLTPVRPSIHMPRWACRMLLHVTDVLFHPLYEITAQDAVAEGIEGKPLHYADYLDPVRTFSSPIDSYRSLWAKLHGTESLNANPDVVGIAFTVEHLCAAKA